VRSRTREAKRAVLHSLPLAQGNILAGQQVVDAMAEAFELLPRRLAHDAPAPQAIQELPPGKDLDVLDETGGALVADEDGVARAVVRDKCTEGTQIR
jgi:hypothetical protein